MKKKISIVVSAIATLCIGLHPASLLGIPLNLKVEIELRNVDAPACEFYTDDVLTGPLRVKVC
jgi:hypothetical protein